MKRKLKLEKLEAAAKLAMREAIGSTQLHPSLQPRSAMVAHVQNDKTQFEFCIVGERPEDALVLSTAVVDAYTGEVLSVAVSADAITAAQQGIQRDGPASGGSAR